MNNLGKLGGQTGVLLCLIGFVAIFFGWNGAASQNVPMAQFPYLISGGITGLAVVVIGSAMLLVQNAREDRARLEAALERVVTALEHGGGVRAPAPVVGGTSGPAGAAGSGTMVLAGTASYHRLDCVLPATREEAHMVALEDAALRDLAPCRVCSPPAIARPLYR